MTGWGGGRRGGGGAVNGTLGLLSIYTPIYMESKYKSPFPFMLSSQYSK